MRRAALFLAVLAAGCASRTRAPKTAQALAGVGTGVSSALMLSSFVVGVDPQDGAVNRPLLLTGVATSVVTPSLGHFYAGEYFPLGIGIRAAAGMMGIVGATRTEDRACRIDPTQNCPILTDGGTALLGLAAIAFIGGAAYDLADAAEATKRFNSKHAAFQLAVTPNGVLVGGRF